MPWPSPVTYSDFVNQNGGTVSAGGAWTVDASSSEVICLSVQPFKCVDVTYCISCLTLERAVQTSYTVKLKANISVPMSQYGDADVLYYDWSYMVAWAADDVPQGGLTLTAHSSVGTSSYSDTFTSDNITEMLTTRQTWIGDPFIHSGSSAVAKYGDPTIGYLPIIIELSYPRQPSTSIDYFMKAASLNITGTTAPTTSRRTSVSSTFSTSPSSALTQHTTIPTSSDPRNSTIASSPSTSDSFLLTVAVGSDGQVYTTLIDGGASVGTLPPTEATKRTSSAIIGAVTGGVCLLLILFLLLWLHIRRKRRHRDLSAALPSPHDINLLSPWSYPPGRSLVSSDFFAESDSKHPVILNEDTEQKHANGTETEQQPASTTVAGPRVDMPPPAYSSLSSPIGRPDNRSRRSRRLFIRRGSLDFIPEGAGLSQWAEENRASIPAKLEAKLEAAGYLPTDDPDAVNEEEWEQKWNVSSVELARVRMLYLKYHGNTVQGTE